MSHRRCDVPATRSKSFCNFADARSDESDLKKNEIESESNARAKTCPEKSDRIFVPNTCHENQEVDGTCSKMLCQSIAS